MSMMQEFKEFAVKGNVIDAKEPAPAEPSEDILLLREIRDNLKK